MDWAVTENRNSTAALLPTAKPAGEWQPDWRASLPLALVAALLVIAGLAFLPYHWRSTSPHPQRVSILLHQQLPQPEAKPRKPEAPPHRTHAHVAPVTRPPSVTIKPPAKPVKPPPINWQQQIDSAAAAQAQARTSVQFNAPRVKPLDRHLEHVLNAPHHVSEMHNGDSYRTADGRTVIKSNGLCGSVKTLQMSSSPTNVATVGTLVPCPGDDKPTMGDDLKAWADKRAKQAPPP